MADESKTENKILTYEEYEKIIQRELDDYNYMIKEVEEQYIDFYKIKEDILINYHMNRDLLSTSSIDIFRKIILDTINIYNGR
jgi:hypothetical protein